MKQAMVAQRDRFSQFFKAAYFGRFLITYTYHSGAAA